MSAEIKNFAKGSVILLGWQSSFLQLFVSQALQFILCKQLLSATENTKTGKSFK